MNEDGNDLDEGCNNAHVLALTTTSHRSSCQTGTKTYVPSPEVIASVHTARLNDQLIREWMNMREWQDAILKARK
jgi:hypothetical protein